MGRDSGRLQGLVGEGFERSWSRRARSVRGQANYADSLGWNDAAVTVMLWNVVLEVRKRLEPAESLWVVR